MGEKGQSSEGRVQVRPQQRTLRADAAKGKLSRRKFLSKLWRGAAFVGIVGGFFYSLADKNPPITIMHEGKFWGISRDDVAHVMYGKYHTSVVLKPKSMDALYFIPDGKAGTMLGNGGRGRFVILLRNPEDYGKCDPGGLRLIDARERFEEEGVGPEGVLEAMNSGMGEGVQLRDKLAGKMFLASSDQSKERVSLYMVQAVLDSEMGKRVDYKRTLFRNTVMRESIRGFQLIYQYGHGKEELPREIGEVFGGLGEMAYGDARIALQRLNYSSLLERGDTGKETHDVMGMLMAELGVKDPLGIVDVKESELVAASKRITERYAKKYYGVGFERAVPPEYIKSVVRQCEDTVF